MRAHLRSEVAAAIDGMIEATPFPSVHGSGGCGRGVVGERGSALKPIIGFIRETRHPLKESIAQVERSSGAA